mmetsp:Transcript_29223/g.80284  ORF Transcript_29223/g.80284 Transcript_29223/m.80284 type:complete len:82 (-) Transcript_29223:240-485(-)
MLPYQVKLLLLVVLLCNVSAATWMRHRLRNLQSSMAPGQALGGVGQTSAPGQAPVVNSAIVKRMMMKKKMMMMKKMMMNNN